MKQEEGLPSDQNARIVKGIICNTVAPGKWVTKGETKHTCEDITTDVAQDRNNTT